MGAKLIISDVFRLADGITVLACEAVGDVGELHGRSADIAVDGITRQQIVLLGERHMLKQQARSRERAIETRENVSLTADDVAGGSAELILSD